MQRPLEQPAKRPRNDGSPRTPPSTRPAAANQSADADFQNSDLRTWDPEDVCSFLEKRGFREKKVLDIFRGSGAEGRRMATVGPSGESPRGRHPKGEARRAEVSGGSGWREPEPGEGGARTGGERTGYPRWAQVKCKPIGSLWGGEPSRCPGRFGRRVFSGTCHFCQERSPPFLDFTPDLRLWLAVFQAHLTWETLLC